MANIDEVVDLIRTTLAIPEVTREAKMGRIRGWDSIRQVRLIVAIEKKFQIKIPTKMIGKLASVDEIFEYLKTTETTTCST